jgi:hypothetical protein
VYQDPVAHAGKPEHEAEHSATGVERAGADAADFLSDAEDGCRHAVAEAAPQISSCRATASS